MTFGWRAKQFPWLKLKVFFFWGGGGGFDEEQFSLRRASALRTAGVTDLYYIKSNRVPKGSGISCYILNLLYKIESISGGSKFSEEIRFLFFVFCFLVAMGLARCAGWRLTKNLNLKRILRSMAEPWREKNPFAEISPHDITRRGTFYRIIFKEPKLRIRLMTVMGRSVDMY